MKKIVKVSDFKGLMRFSLQFFNNLPNRVAERGIFLRNSPGFICSQLRNIPYAFSFALAWLIFLVLQPWPLNFKTLANEK